MPHQCVRCGEIYPNDSQYILKGCPCGSKFYFFVRKENLEQAKEIQINLTVKEKDEIEKEVLDILEEKGRKGDQPVVLDFEAIRVIKPGKFELDLIKLFKGDPVVFKMGEGKYMIDVSSAMSNSLKRK